jgi:hypothetical protein
MALTNVSNAAFDHKKTAPKAAKDIYMAHLSLFFAFYEGWTLDKIDLWQRRNARTKISE